MQVVVTATGSHAKCFLPYALSAAKTPKCLLSPVFFELMFLSPQASREIVSAQRMRSIHAPTYKIAYEAVRSWRIGQRQVHPSNSVLTLSLLSYCIGFCAFHLNATMNLSDSAAREQYMIGLEALLAP